MIPNHLLARPWTIWPLPRRCRRTQPNKRPILIASFKNWFNIMHEEGEHINIHGGRCPSPPWPSPPGEKASPDVRRWIRTHFDISPRVGSRTVNVLRLFQHVVSNGGYDVVSAEKLGWRRIGDELGFATNTVPSLSFSLKSVYYKYLACVRSRSTAWRWGSSDRWT